MLSRQNPVGCLSRQNPVGCAVGLTFDTVLIWIALDLILLVASLAAVFVLLALGIVREDEVGNLGRRIGAGFAGIWLIVAPVLAVVHHLIARQSVITSLIRIFVGRPPEPS